MKIWTLLALFFLTHCKAHNKSGDSELNAGQLNRVYACVGTNTALPKKDDCDQHIRIYIYQNTDTGIINKARYYITDSGSIQTWTIAAKEQIGNIFGYRGKSEEGTLDLDMDLKQVVNTPADFCIPEETREKPGFRATADYKVVWEHGSQTKTYVGRKKDIEPKKKKEDQAKADAAVGVGLICIDTNKKKTAL